MPVTRKEKACVQKKVSENLEVQRGELVRFLRRSIFNLKASILPSPLIPFVTSFMTNSENIRRAPPAEEEWWEDANGCESEQDYGLECSYDEDDFSRDRYATIESVRSGPSTRFHNCGFETWTKARAEWKKKTVETLPPRPKPAEYNQLVKGLTRSSALRTYELPRRMVLSDLIDVYTDIWDGQGV
jgi:hypothetical protein